MARDDFGKQVHLTRSNALWNRLLQYPPVPRHRGDLKAMPLASTLHY